MTPGLMEYRPAVKVETLSSNWKLTLAGLMDCANEYVCVYVELVQLCIIFWLTEVQCAVRVLD